MADFHIKDTYGNNYKIGGNVSGIYHLPISKLFVTREIQIINATQSISAGSTLQEYFNIQPYTNNNAKYVPIAIAGYSLSADSYIRISSLVLNSETIISYILDNPTTSSRNVYGFYVYLTFACATVPWLNV